MRLQNLTHAVWKASMALVLVGIASLAAAGPGAASFGNQNCNDATVLDTVLDHGEQAWRRANGGNKAQGYKTRGYKTQGNTDAFRCGSEAAAAAPNPAIQVADARTNTRYGNHGFQRPGVQRRGVYGRNVRGVHGIRGNRGNRGVRITERRRAHCRPQIQLKNGERVQRNRRGQFISGGTCFVHATCAGGRLHRLGNGVMACKIPTRPTPTVPTCAPAIQLSAGQQVWQTATGFKDRAGRCFTQAICQGGNLVARNGDTRECVVAPTCGGNLALTNGQSVWQRADGTFRTQSGQCHKTVSCASGKIVSLNGDTRQCQVPQCGGNLALTNGQSVWQRADGTFRTQSGQCHKTVSCAGGKIVSLNGDTRQCQVPQCDGNLALTNGQSVWQRADGTFRTQSGQCHKTVSCAGGKIVPLNGDTRQCQVPQCGGNLALTNGQTVWQRPDGTFRTRSGQCHKTVSCAGGTIAPLNGDARQCQVPQCHPLALQAGQSVWKNADGSFKTQDGRCVKPTCSGGMLKPAGGDRYTCEKAPVCTGQTRSLPSSAELCASEGSTCWVKRGYWVYYGQNGCYNRRQANGDTHCNNGVFGDPLVGVKKSCWKVRD